MNSIEVALTDRACEEELHRLETLALEELVRCRSFLLRLLGGWLPRHTRLTPAERILLRLLGGEIIPRLESLLSSVQEAIVETTTSAAAAEEDSGQQGEARRRTRRGGRNRRRPADQDEAE